MVGTEQEALAFAVTECATTGKEWVISALADGEETVVWKIERDTKVDEEDLTWPVIVHLRGSMSSDTIAILTEVAAMQEP